MPRLKYYNTITNEWEGVSTKGDPGKDGSSLLLDATLTKSNYAADAKAVGDAIRNISDNTSSSANTDEVYVLAENETLDNVPDGIVLVIDMYGELSDMPGMGGNTQNGEDGFSPIATVTKTDSGAVISITDKTGTTIATIYNGKDGADGQPGKDGTNGAPGEKGDKGDPGEPGQKGDKGDPGEKGDKGDTGSPGADGANGKDGSPGADGITPHVGSNGNWFIGDTDTGIPATGPAGGQGLPGTPGEPGKDGTSATHSWNGTVLTITSASGTSSADLKGDKGDTGAKGDKGDKGDTGATGAAGKDGANGKDGKTPVRGTDYWTASDIAEIKSYVDNAILGGAW